MEQSRSAWRQYILLSSLGLTILLFALDTYPRIWFDEGYRANAAYTVAEHGVYGTFTVDGFAPFDPGMSSGPVDIFFVALSFKLLNIGVAQARLVSVLFTLIATISLYHIVTYIYGSRAGLFIILFMMAFPAILDTGFLLIGRQILGEPAALALIALGLWVWFVSWKSETWLPSLVAGLLIGLGLLSKTQFAIALIPTLGLIGLMRGLQDRSRLVRDLIPVIVSTAVVAAWIFIGRAYTPPDIAQRNTQLLLDAITTNLITGLMGSVLTRWSFIVIAVLGIGILSRLWHRYRPMRHLLPQTPEQWAEMTIIAFVGLSATWYTLLSIGWPRYAYAALAFGLLLVGKLVWDIFNAIVPARLYSIGVAALALLAIATNLGPALQYKRTNYAEETSTFIQTNIPSTAVIETWEWELDPLSNPARIHHPGQNYLFQAIRQFSHEKRDFDLDYNLLQADPDYLITGIFSDWTGIYDRTLIDANFTEIMVCGTYRIYERQRTRAITMPS